MIDKTVSVIDADSVSSAAVAQMLRAMGVNAVLYNSAIDFLDRFDPTRPGCVILEVRIPGMNGLQLQDELSARQSPLPLVFLTQHGTVATAVRAIQAGAVHFLEKPFSEVELLQAVTEALALDEQRRIAFEIESTIHQRLAKLDAEECHLARRIVDGLSNRQIARETGVCLRTVELRRSRMMKKLQVSNISQLVPFCWALDRAAGQVPVP